ncbi:hypothetical protein ACJJWD_16315 [Comamonas testosteroni]|uniref:hypothetical protein n=1 Tax=Comamonas testosteroni TaxID=285 RepID=UPI00389A0B06
MKFLVKPNLCGGKPAPELWNRLKAKSAEPVRALMKVSRNLGQARTASCHQQLKYISDVVRGVITVDAFLALVN